MQFDGYIIIINESNVIRIECFKLLSELLEQIK
jgi:hypothetical protein